ncbi:ABC transporter ATP-binding protein [Leeia oryzae]|uniref:ABC transporter ATP-binding protein n=1 Tax=Leeia oryzae TaxID=356662 RepID=UPI000369E93A|nr:ABC transporter ATP-binding protein [Leeia oryzae]
MLNIEAVSKCYPGQSDFAVNQASLQLEAGETLVLLGPSGCGKTTLLRQVAGLETLDSGSVCWQKRDMASIPPEQRRFAMVFQDYALFAHLTVGENVAFALVEQQQSKSVIETQVGLWLTRLQISHLAHRYVHELSGGQQQRVAVARALAANPQLLLLDEPFSNLDAVLRLELQAMLRALLVETGQTALMVTHDQQEAFALADQIAMMRDGKIIQTGRPAEIYARPANMWVANFLGHRNIRDQILWPEEAFLLTGPEQGRITAVKPQGDTVQLSVFAQDWEWHLQLSRREWMQVGLAGVGDSIPFSINPQLAYPLDRT